MENSGEGLTMCDQNMTLATVWLTLPAYLEYYEVSMGTIVF